MKRTYQTMPTNRTNTPESAEATQPAANGTDQPVAEETVERPQMTATETKLVKVADLLKADAKAVSDNVRNAREAVESLARAVDPITVLCRNLGILDNDGNLDNETIPAVADALAIRDIPVNWVEYLQSSHLIANALRAPNLDSLANADIKNEADKLGDVLKAVEYLDADETVINHAKMALAAYHASQGALRDWLNKTNRTVPSRTGTKGATVSGAANGGKYRQTDKVRDLINADVQYNCDNCGQVGYVGGTTVSGVKHAIRAHYRDCRKLSEAETDGSSQTFRDISEALDKVLESPTVAEAPGGNISRV